MSKLIEDIKKLPRFKGEGRLYLADVIALIQQHEEEIAITEDDYDAVMSEAEKVYLDGEKCEDPYSFHKAFEFAIRKLPNKRVIVEAAKMGKLIEEIKNIFAKQKRYDFFTVGDVKKEVLDLIHLAIGESQI